MSKSNSQLYRSFEILNSVLLVVAVTYLFDFLLLLLQPGFLFVLLLAIPIKTVFLSAFYGSIIEIVSGEELFISIKNLKRNAKELWWITLGITSALPLAYFVLSLFTNNAFSAYYAEFNVHLNIAVIGLLSYALIYKKYLKHPPLSFSLTALGAVFLLYAGNVFIYSLPRILQNPNWQLFNIIIFISIYLNYLTFIFFSIIFIDANPEITKPFTHKKEFIIVNPLNSGIIDSLVFSMKSIYPSTTGILYAMTPKDYKIRVINNIVFRKRFFQADKLVAITCYTSNCYEAYWIAKGYKKMGSKVVMGGPHVSTLPDEALAFCDSVVIGEVESVWEQVIRDYENNSLKDKYFGEALENFSEKWHKQMLDIPAEIIKDSIETARGCKFDCDFCTSPELVGRTIRKRPVSEIVETIKKIRPKYNSIFFNDADIFADPRHAKELFKALIPLKIRWRSHCVITIANDDEALDLAQKSGCSHLAIGLETNNPKAALIHGGKLKMHKRYGRNIRKIKEKGIGIIPLFIVGFETDNLLSTIRLLFFSLRMLGFRMTLSRLTPLPGTRLYFNLLKQGRLINLNWRKYDLKNVVFKKKPSL